MDTFEAIKAEIDKELKDQNADKGIGVAFGLKLYGEFGQRGWIKMKNPDAPGFPSLMPFYNDIHYAHADWDRGEMDWAVGKK